MLMLEEELREAQALLEWVGEHDETDTFTADDMAMVQRLQAWLARAGVRAALRPARGLPKTIYVDDMDVSDSLFKVVPTSPHRTRMSVYVFSHRVTADLNGVVVPRREDDDGA